MSADQPEQRRQLRRDRAADPRLTRKWLSPDHPHGRSRSLWACGPSGPRERGLAGHDQRGALAVRAADDLDQALAAGALPAAGKVQVASSPARIGRLVNQRARRAPRPRHVRGQESVPGA